MTRDELVSAIDTQIITAPPFASGGYTRFLHALRSVVELHEPYGDIMCVICEGISYPCSTIKAIEKELNG